MLVNYFKIAIAVLKRRKFFTFISIFIISFTITILVVLAAFIDKVVNDTYPDRNRSRLLYITKFEESGPQSMNSGALSFYYLNRYVKTLKRPARIAISSRPQGTNTYVNNKKISINYKYTDAAYWEVLDHDFLEGKPFTAQQLANGERVAVISERLRKEYFGNAPSVVGQYIEADAVRYRVCGIMKSVPPSNYLFSGDLFLPYTVAKTDIASSKDYRGNFICVLEAPTRADVPAMKAEYEQMAARLPMTNNQYTHIYTHADSYLNAYLRSGNEKKSGMRIVSTVVTIFVLLVMLLPAMNLVNINVTRIMERSSEIGVRKAFGASSKVLAGQFIIENLILTLISGLVSVVLSLIALQLINRANLLNDLHLSLNFNVLLVTLLACLVFGLLSGAYPAWRMSRMQVINALKAS
ncbi:ABC transporter permease [uncultured Chitinophaga sp.]|jgi:ABC-type antimicrobial peptide transport system, permease component|uniref:ABC transporter permease n=1 Tax=uncultured Chitinophaga sp. TaxID=339340 RepID=UPI00261CF46E|nr:ABC transporter permease [uncultured Chitinophaga sp.]